MNLSNKVNRKVFSVVMVAIVAIVAVAVSVIATTQVTLAQVDVGINAAGGGMANPDVDNVVGDVVNIFLYIIGIAAVVMVIFSGFQFITSAGDAQKAGKARSTLLYSIIGLVVAILAFAIVNFVVDRL